MDWSFLRRQILVVALVALRQVTPALVWAD